VNNEAFHKLYDFSGQVVVVTGTVIPVDGGFSAFSGV
jgi:hypothetical protein